MNPYIKQANQQFVPVYNRYSIVWDHGEGMYLYDTEGKRYLDFGSGIGVCALGYHDQNYTRTLQEQMEKLLHTSNLFYNVPAIEAAKLFNQASGMEQVFFTNSGTEAIEGAVKIAKKYHFLKHNNHNGENHCHEKILSRQIYGQKRKYVCVSAVRRCSRHCGFGKGFGMRNSGRCNWNQRGSNRCIVCRRSWHNLRLQSSGRYCCIPALSTV